MSDTPQVPTGTFNPAKVILTFASTTIVGLAKGTQIKVSRDSDQTTDDVGANGDVVVVINNDERGYIDLELLQSSPSNDFLSEQAELFKAGGGTKPVECIDLNGTSVASGLDAWVVKLADSEYATEAANRAWRIRVARLKHFVGAIS